MNRNANNFKLWIKKNKIDVIESIDIESNLKIGQKVTYTNEFGVKFTGRTILGFCSPFYGRCVYLDNDSYWFPVSPASLTVESN